MFARSESGPHGGFVSPPSLSRYRPIAPIGRGSTAEIILAERHGGNGAELAVLRRLWPDRAGELASLAAFLEAARLGERLGHPNVVQTHERLEDGGRPTVAMEYLDGQPLAEVLRRLTVSNTFSLTLRLRILVSVLSALHYAHELRDDRGVAAPLLHGQVNPRNVFVTYAGRVKLLGLGRRAPAAGTARAIEQLAYLAPEQLCGDAGGAATDTFAVGMMLWEMMGRRRRWAGMSDADIFGQLSRRIPVPPLGSASQFPSALIKICARAVAPQPANRYASAAELASDLVKMLPRPGEADERHLGKVVSLAFGAEREARRALIDLNQPREGTVVAPAAPFRPRVVVVTPPSSPCTPWPAAVRVQPLPRARVAAPPTPSLSLSARRPVRVFSGAVSRVGWLLAGVALAAVFTAAVLVGASTVRGLTAPAATVTDAAPVPREAAKRESTPAKNAPPQTSDAPEPRVASTPASTSSPAPLSQIVAPVPEACCAEKQGAPRGARQEHPTRRAPSSAQAADIGQTRPALTFAPDDDVLPPSLDLGGSTTRAAQLLRRSPPPPAGPKAASSPSPRPIDVADPFSQP